MSDWRKVGRNSGGPVLLPDVNLMDALRELLEFEEICQAAGCAGVEQLRNLLSNVLDRTDGRVLRGWRRKLSDGAARGAWAEAHNVRRYWERGAASEAYPSGAARHLPLAGEVKRNHCRECKHFRPGPEKTPKMGHCAVHGRRIHKKGGHMGPAVEVPGEPRPVAASRKACKDKFEQRQPGPQWVGPSAELMTQED